VFRRYGPRACGVCAYEVDPQYAPKPEPEPKLVWAVVKGKLKLVMK
jgi:hypothetical protein